MEELALNELADVSKQLAHPRTATTVITEHASGLLS
jgi:hypothetical protein